MTKKVEEKPTDPRIAGYAIGHKLNILSPKDAEEFKRLLKLSGAKFTTKLMFDGSETFGEIFKVEAFGVVGTK